MSAIEQPAARSGSTTVTRRPVGENIGRLGHEVYAAKGDRATIAADGRLAAEFEAIAAQIRQRDHLVLLVMMAEDQQRRAHLRPDRLDPPRQLGAVERFVGLERKGRGGCVFECNSHIRGGN
jgi:hypothetical protein